MGCFGIFLAHGKEQVCKSNPQHCILIFFQINVKK
jgi:hypothetical protein